MFDTIQHTLSAAVATSGTFTVAYPTGRDAGHYAGARNHKLSALGADRSSPSGFTVSFGTSNITVTYLGTTTLPAGTVVWLQLDRLSEYPGRNELIGRTARTGHLTPVLVNLGAPDAADADGVCASQSGTASTAMTINGALAASGVATFDVPRNVVAAWTNTAVLTVTGTDEYGNTVVESSASGTSMAGKKAFKTITSVVPSANITGATVGSGDVLGLPLFLENKGHVLREMEDGVAATAGTLVAGVTSAATATTGDVRGTYDPNSACDGSKAFTLVAAVTDPNDRGVSQYAG